jgi:transposase
MAGQPLPAASRAATAPIYGCDADGRNGLGRVAKPFCRVGGESWVVSRDVISDEAWAVIGRLFPTAKARGRPPVDRRMVVEATAWRYRTGAPWRVDDQESLVCDGKGRALAFILTPGQAADTSMLPATLEQIRVPGPAGRPRTCPQRVIADKGYPSRANRAWLREHGVAATIPERDDKITHRRKRPGRPIDFGDDQKVRYRGRNVVERRFNKLKQWRGIAMRSDKTARNYQAGLCIAATLHWLATSVRSTPYALRCRSRTSGSCWKPADL